MPFAHLSNFQLEVIWFCLIFLCFTFLLDISALFSSPYLSIFFYSTIPSLIPLYPFVHSRCTESFGNLFPSNPVGVNPPEKRAFFHLLPLLFLPLPPSLPPLKWISGCGEGMRPSSSTTPSIFILERQKCLLIRSPLYFFIPLLSYIVEKIRNENDSPSMKLHIDALSRP